MCTYVYVSGEPSGPSTPSEKAQTKNIYNNKCTTTTTTYNNNKVFNTFLFFLFNTIHLIDFLSSMF